LTPAGKGANFGLRGLFVIRRFFKMLEKRKKDRQVCVGNVYYTNGKGGPNAEVRTARCSNVSPSGMCIFTYNPIPPGSVIKISRIEKSGDRKAASVRWCEKLDEHLFREGISYLK
jgi:hypothetical protein